MKSAVEVKEAVRTLKEGALSPAPPKQSGG